MTIQEYLIIIDKEYKKGISSEHSYRGYLQELIKGLDPKIEITNEPKGVTDCGNPDYVITNKKIPIGYIEAKDVGKDLNSKLFKEQFDRYKKALDNLIITDYTFFQFFENGVLIDEIRIGEIHENAIKPITYNFTRFENRIRNFCIFIGQTIKSSKKLAEMMAAKARLLQNVLESAVTTDEMSPENTSLKDQYKTFKDILIHDLQPKEFADIYAQTLAYGMFAARLHDKTLDDFSRQEAAELIPKSNPFLRKLFGYVAGPDIDDRLVTTVDNLADVFRATNVDELLHNFGKSTQTNDPIIHFYETFLAEYDPKLRKSRGVWYTPEPVVNFIVRAVDDILKTEFGLSEGLADTSKTKIKVPNPGGKGTITKEVHKVQILDPATGTGTFLAEVVKHIYNNNFKNMQGVWSSYVENDLIPRLNGFELLMASYSMAHLKLDMLLTETGYKPTRNQRFNIYLTNSLEEHHQDTGTLFSNWLSSEANEANHIKRDTPVMCVIGNPPYAVSSRNKGDWIESLMVDYKKEPEGKVKLQERNSKLLNDDYVKFIRYAQYLIEKNGEGVLAFINPHGYLDNSTFRGMRWNLLKTYDKIYTLDLHGNSKKKEVCPDGSQDVNVFDIMQGVSINIFVKTGKKKKNELGKVFHSDLYGKRQEKYQYLWNNNIKSVPNCELQNIKPDYFFLPKDFKGKGSYDNGFNVKDLFIENTSGLKTHRDAFVIDIDKTELVDRMTSFYDLDNTNEHIMSSYKLKANKEWLDEKRQGSFDIDSIKKISYRPFDDRFIYYSQDVVDRGREKIFKRTIAKDNIGLLTCRQLSTFDFQHVLCSRYLVDMCSVSLQTKETGYYFPLYLYPDSENDLENQGRTPNLNLEIVDQIAKKLGLEFVTEKTGVPTTPSDTVVHPSTGGECGENSPPVEGCQPTADGVVFAPIDILDYIYAVLHSPTYREKYKEFLKIDFPRVPYPKDKETFWKLVKLGGEIRQIHLLESFKVEEFITSYPVGGDNIVVNPKYKENKVYINDTQHFDNVPLVAWEFYIGGYQPAQKWLKDRKGRELTYEDIKHYQKIIVALTETDRIMKEIDEVGVE
ncbi:MAG: N-6 DNA methylase [Candidatus Delongbacteria bacterium]|jgi:predicted helicase|nr:N-6 DNA methylase [Candidatus Delongbacteria bacterium]